MKGLWPNFTRIPRSRQTDTEITEPTRICALITSITDGPHFNDRLRDYPGVLGKSEGADATHISEMWSVV